MRYLHLASASLLAALAQPALADTLADAIASAYSNNPEITAARAQLRAIDETVEIARTDTRPNVGVSGSFTNQLTDRFGNYGQIWTGGIQITQPVWEGGRVRAGISAADVAHAEPVEAQAVATTVIENYGACHKNEALLVGWQEWWSGVEQACSDSKACQVAPPDTGSGD